jgi:squalene cyclase
MNAEKAIRFITEQGSPVELARLEYLRTGQPPSRQAVEALLAGQQDDGGWAPFWAPGYSSLDATCFRLAQAEQLGLLRTENAIVRASRLIGARQLEDGSWEENGQVASIAPPWARPGDQAARLYLTANCGFWLSVIEPDGSKAKRAADFLLPHLNLDGQLPSFLQTHWLAGGLSYYRSTFAPIAQIVGQA